MASINSSEHAVNLQLMGRLMLVLLVAGCVVADTAPFTSYVLQYNPGALQQIKSQVTQASYRVLREYPDYNSIIVAPPATQVEVASAPGSAAVTPEQVVSTLSVLPDAVAVTPNPKLSLIQPVRRAVSDADAQAVSQPAADRPGKVVTCPSNTWGLGPDEDLARNGTEGTPYGIKMVQASHPDMVAISTTSKGKVLFCIVDTGADLNNTDLKAQNITACSPGFPDGDATKFKYCTNLQQDDYDRAHGSHTAGTVAAVRNGKGVVGVSAQRAQMYNYNGFNLIGQDNSLQLDDDLLVASWQECIAELDRRKVATRTPDMKLVISMSLGGAGAGVLSTLAIQKLAASRKDVMWLAASGNNGPNATLSYPAGFKEVISVGAVNWNMVLADFSSWNDQTPELTAPGVDTLSTIPLWNSPTSSYYIKAVRDTLMVHSRIPGVANNSQFFNTPTAAAFTGSGTVSATGKLVDCGLGTKQCTNATGRICLIQRGNNTFCEKVTNCMAGGGSGALVFNRDDLPDCDVLIGTLTGGTAACTAPADGFVISISIAKAQGSALRDALSAGRSVSVTLTYPTATLQTSLALDIYSGTSMATPTAAGVAGLVWSAHSDCTTDEIRAALRASALMPPNASMPTSSGRDIAYGYGMVQGLAAHKYLQSKPCKGGRQLQLLVEHDLPAGALAGSASPVRITVREPTGAPVAGALVKIGTTPAGAILCSSKLRRTGTDGTVPRVVCTLKKAAQGTGIIVNVDGIPGAAPARNTVAFP